MFNGVHFRSFLVTYHMTKYVAHIIFLHWLNVDWIFKRIIRDDSNVLWYLLPAKRDVHLTARLRCARQYSTIYARNKRYKNSLIVYGLNHWQQFRYHSIVLCMRCILLYVCVIQPLLKAAKAQ